MVQVTREKWPFLPTSDTAHLSNLNCTILIQTVVCLYNQSYPSHICMYLSHICTSVATNDANNLIQGDCKEIVHTILSTIYRLHTRIAALRQRQLLPTRAPAARTTLQDRERCTPRGRAATRSVAASPGLHGKSFRPPGGCCAHWTFSRHARLSRLGRRTRAQLCDWISHYIFVIKNFEKKNRR